MAKRREFQIITGLPPEQFLSRLSELSTEEWTVEAFESGAVAGGPGTYTALMSREARKPRKAEGSDSDD